MNKRVWGIAWVGCATAAVGACVGDSSSPSDGGTDATADAAADVTKNDGQANDSGNDALADASTNDADAAPAACNPTAAFGAPVPLTALNTGYNTMGGFINEATHEFYFTRWAQANVSDYHPKTPSRIYRATTIDAGVFGTPTLVTGASDPDLDAGDYDYWPTVTPDGLNLYFDSYRPATPNADVYLSTRPNVTATWGDASVSVFTNTTQSEYPIPGAIYAPDNGPLVRYTLDTSDNVGSPTNVDPDAGTVNAGNIVAPVITPNELHLYFTSTRNNVGGFRIFSSDRASTTSPWSTPAVVGLGVSSNLEFAAYVTSDNCTLYFSSSRTGPMQMYYATRGN